ncbi:membrane hypothetical protein [uncultured delta proteobacterium]|uniref:Uncharacterized protein n=1 Tax=uncultured delta proteobacterium TaxID=34034 RepID=A0A212KAF0_9DELT|nr:membrane hypothetical protein [uncultured delta proteobacterium]
MPLPQQFPVAVTDTRTLAVFLGCCFGLLLGLFCFLGYFAFPIADDHSFALALERIGSFGLFTEMYFKAAGRYTANLLYSVTGVLVANPGWYHAIALFQISCLVAAIRALVSACHAGSRGSAWLITLCLSAAFIATLPSPSQGLYWLPGTIVYFVSFNALFALGAVMGIAAFTPSRLRKWHGAAGFILVIVIMGVNEITACVTEFFLLAAWVCALRRKHPATRFFGCLFLVGTIGILVSLSAPGNFNRLDEIDELVDRGWKWGFLLNSLGGAFEGYKWLVHGAVLPAIAVSTLYFIPRWVPDGHGLTLPRRLALVLALGCMLFFGEFLFVYISTKRAPYARIVNAIYDGTFVYALAAAAFLMQDILRLRTWLALRFGTRKVLAVAAALAVLFMALQPTVTAAVRNTVNGEFAAYRKVWLERLALIPPKPEGRDIVLALPPLRSRPFPLIFRDLEEQQAKHQWVKSVFAEYHGLKDVRIVREKADQPGK